MSAIATRAEEHLRRCRAGCFERLVPSVAALHSKLGDLYQPFVEAYKADPKNDPTRKYAAAAKSGRLEIDGRFLVAGQSDRVHIQMRESEAQAAAQAGDLWERRSSSPSRGKSFRTAPIVSLANCWTPRSRPTRKRRRNSRACPTKIQTTKISSTWKLRDRRGRDLGPYGEARLTRVDPRLSRPYGAGQQYGDIPNHPRRWPDVTMDLRLYLPFRAFRSAQNVSVGAVTCSPRRSSSRRITRRACRARDAHRVRARAIRN